MKAALTVIWDVIRYLVAVGLLFAFFWPIARAMGWVASMGIVSEETGHRYNRLLVRWRINKEDRDAR